MDIMTTVDSGHSLVQNIQEPQPLSSTPPSPPTSPSTSDNNNYTNSIHNSERENQQQQEEEEESGEQCDKLTTINDCTGDDPTADNDDFIPPMKLHVTVSVSGKKQYRKRKPKSTEDKDYSLLMKKKFSFIPKEKVTTRATTPSERLFCRKCNIQLFSYNLFEYHTIDHALKSPVTVCVERLHLSSEVLEALAAAKQREEEKRYEKEREREEASGDYNRIEETIEGVVSKVLAGENIEGIEKETESERAEIRSADSFDKTEDQKSVNSSFEASSSFNQSLEKFQTDMIEELHQQIRSLSEASSTYEDKDGQSMSSDQSEPGEVKDSGVIITNPRSLKEFVTNTQLVSEGGEANQYDRYCPSVAIIEKEPNLSVPAPAQEPQERFPAPSVLSAILSSTNRPPPPLQSMARMAFLQTPNSPNTRLIQPKPFGQQSIDNGRPASVIYVDTVRSQLPSIESVVSLAPGYRQPPHYSNITFPTNNGSSNTDNNTPSDANSNKVTHDATVHVTAGGSTCACTNCKDLLEGSLLRQAKILLPDGFVEFFCPICKRRFQRKSSLWRHCRNANHGYICNMCGSGFLKPDMFEEHRKLHVARLNPQSCTDLRNAQGSTTPSPSTITSQNNVARQSNPTPPEHLVRRPGQPQPQLTSRLNAVNPSTTTPTTSMVTAAAATKDDDVIVVAVGKRTPPVTQNAPVVRNVTNQALQGNARPQKEGMSVNSSPAKSNPPPSQNINRILKSNEITLTPIRSLQSTFGEGTARTARMPPPPPLHPNQPQMRTVLRPQGPPPHRFEGPHSYPQQQQQQRPSLQQQQQPNNMPGGMRMAMVRTVRPPGPSTITSQPTQMNANAAFAMPHSQTLRGQLMTNNGNRTPQLHPNQMMNPTRMAQPGGVRMPMWHHPVPTSSSTSAAVIQRPIQFTRPPQLVPVSSGGRMPMAAQSMAMTRPSILRSSMGHLVPRRPGPPPGHIMPTNMAPNGSTMRLPNSQQNAIMQRMMRPPPPYFRQPGPLSRVPTAMDDMTLKCVHCDATFTNSTALQAHFNEFHTASLSCRRCNGKFRSVISLKRHEAVCIEKVRCLKCKQVMHHDQLIAHITEVHYPKGNDGNPISQQPLPYSSVASTSSLSLVQHTQPSVNVSWTNVALNSGMILNREVQNMPPEQVVNTTAIRTPVISSVVSLSRTSPLYVAELPASNSSGINVSTIILNSSETPIVIEDDPVSSVLPDADDTNGKGSPVPPVQEETTSTDKPTHEVLDTDDRLEGTSRVPVEEKLPDIVTELPVDETLPLEDKPEDESVSKTPNAEEEEKEKEEEEEQTKAISPPSEPNPVVTDVQSGVEFENKDVGEKDSTVDIPLDTPSPSPENAPFETVVATVSEKKLVCPICDHQLESNEAFLKHIQIHNSDEVFECALCDTAFNTKRLLVLHLRSHMRSCTKRIGKSPDAKRRRLNGPPNFDISSSFQSCGTERLGVALIDMDKVASSVSVLRNMGVVGFMSIDDFADYLSRKKTADNTEVDEELPIMRLPNSESVQES